MRCIKHRKTNPLRNRTPKNGQHKQATYDACRLIKPDLLAVTISALSVLPGRKQRGVLEGKVVGKPSIPDSLSGHGAESIPERLASGYTAANTSLPKRYIRGMI
jgi:hypothetical protein